EQDVGQLIRAGRGLGSVEYDAVDGYIFRVNTRLYVAVDVLAAVRSRLVVPGVADLELLPSVAVIIGLGLGRADRTGRYLSDLEVVVVVVQVLGDDYPIVLCYAVSDIVVSKLVGLAASNDLGRRNIGNLLDVNRLDVSGIDLVVVVGVDQGDHVGRLLILEC